MIGKVLHIGLTVSDIEKSIKFYTEKLGLKLENRMTMEGKNTDILFGKENIRVEIAYLNGSSELNCPPIELICFSKNRTIKEENDLQKTSISEVCFYTDNIDLEYERLKGLGVEFISSPQSFTFNETKSKAVYFRDPDGIILELIEIVTK